jgi:hypothetical protein
MKLMCKLDEGQGMAKTRRGLGAAQRCRPWSAMSATLAKVATATLPVHGVVATCAMGGAGCGQAERVQGQGSGRQGEARRRRGNEQVRVA